MNAIGAIEEDNLSDTVLMESDGRTLRTYMLLWKPNGNSHMSLSSSLLFPVGVGPRPCFQVHNTLSSVCEDRPMVSEVMAFKQTRSPYQYIKWHVTPNKVGWQHTQYQMVHRINIKFKFAAGGKNEPRQQMAHKHTRHLLRRAT